MDPIKVKVGDVFAVPLTVSVGGQIAAVAIFTAFDKTLLRCESIETGALADTLVATADNDEGRIDFAALSLHTSVDGSVPVTVATVKFTALAVTPGTPLVYGYMAPRKTQGAYAGQALDIGQTDLIIVVEEVPPPPPPPLTPDIVGGSLLALAYGSKIGDPAYNPSADLNQDGVVDDLDFELFKADYVANLNA